ncbi:MAG: glycosyltransferase family 39 protein [Anaerolineales bacterium]
MNASATTTTRLRTSISWQSLAIAAFALLGVLLRLRHFLSGRSLWVDEAMLALNILQRNFAGLLQQPMEYGQGAPIGYLFSVKVLTLLLGDSEYALRFFSLLAGLAALALMIVLARQCLDRTGAVIAVALFACMPSLVYYSGETKQYMGDVLVCLLFLFIFFRMLHKPATGKDFVLFGAAGTLLLWFSHPAVFVAAGVGLTLFLHYWLAKDRTRMLWTALCGAVWSLNVGVLYVVNLRHLAASEYLLTFWQSGFMELPPWRNPTWFAHIWDSLLKDPLGLGIQPLIGFLLFGAGIVFLFRRDWRSGALILLPLLLALAASALHKYSLLGRMLLFAVPLFVIGLAAGVNGLAGLVKNRYGSHGLRLLMAVYLLWAPLHTSLAEFAEPKTREHIKPSMQYLQESRKPGDVIYVYYNTVPAFRFYAPKYGLAPGEFIIGADHSTDPEAYYPELDALDGEKRVWLIFSHVYERGEFNERDFILAYADGLGKRVREFRIPATTVYLYLYDLR